MVEPERGSSQDLIGSNIMTMQCNVSNTVMILINASDCWRKINIKFKNKKNLKFSDKYEFRMD